MFFIIPCCFPKATDPELRDRLLRKCTYGIKFVIVGMAGWVVSVVLASVAIISPDAFLLIFIGSFAVFCGGTVYMAKNWLDAIAA